MLNEDDRSYILNEIYMSYLEHFNTNLEHLLQSLNEYYTHSHYNTPLEGDIYLKQFLTNFTD